MQLFVRNSTTHVLQLPENASGRDLYQAVEVRTGLPREFFWLSFCGRRLKDDLLSGLSGLARDSSVQLVHRLLGGKGGFGALLRGAGRAALTDNFDACRDLNGRRLRHVNADKKLEDWAAEAKERQLEKIAMKHLREQERERNKAQKAQVNLDGVQAEQNRALAGVMAALDAGFATEAPDNKRKAAGTPAETDMAKRRRFLETLLEGDDSDDSSFDSEDENLAEAAIAEWLSGKGTAQLPSSNGAGPSSDSEASAQELQPSTVSEAVQQATREASADLHAQQPDLSNPILTGPQLSRQSPALLDASLAQQLGEAPATEELAKHSEGRDQSSAAATESTQLVDAVQASSAAVKEDNAGQAAASQPETQAKGKPASIVLQGFAGSAELEQLGLDVLKQQLQLHGLKCGGSLAERAARLFLLRDTPVSKLDTKHFPKGRK